VEEKKLMPENQAGFRKERSTIDNIFVLNHLMQRETKQEEKDDKVYMLFADLKAAFDNVDRKILWEELRRGEVEESLIRKMEEMYEQTEMVRTSQGYTERFRTRKGVRQGNEFTPF